MVNSWINNDSGEEIGSRSRCPSSYWGRDNIEGGALLLETWSLGLGQQCLRFRGGLRRFHLICASASIEQSAKSRRRLRNICQACIATVPEIVQALFLQYRRASRRETSRIVVPEQLSRERDVNERESCRQTASLSSMGKQPALNFSVYRCCVHPTPSKCLHALSCWGEYSGPYACPSRPSTSPVSPMAAKCVLGAYSPRSLSLFSSLHDGRRCPSDRVRYHQHQPARDFDLRVVFDI